MTSTDTGTRTAVRQSKGYRPDIEGMRAIAIGLVLVYHAGVWLLPGGFVGVDVFFVISGFLITGLLIREIEKNGRISLRLFYARRAKRLLPATGVVLVATAILTWLTTSVVEWRTFGADIIASALYVVNWQLAFRSVDYLAEDTGLSPVQHFWSLAVEEQFYIVWPLLLVLLAWWLRRRTHARLRPVLTAGIVLVIVPSFLYSVYLTGANPASAFFVTPTRLWELGIGALVAIGATVWSKVPKAVAIVLGWAGFTAVLASGFIFSSATAWPGYAAMLPTLGTAAMIVAGYTSGNAGPAGLLSWRPAVWVGGLSYSLYLWHWPLLVSATALWGELGGRRGLLVVAVSFIPAYLCYRFIENPIRFAKPLARSNRLTLSIGANFTLVGVVAGLVLALAVPTTSNNTGDDATGGAAIGSEDGEAEGPGDNAAEIGSVESLTDVDWFTPEATAAVADVPDAYDADCQVDQIAPDPVRCEYGDPDGEVTLAIAGDSKILQWESAIEEIALEQGWRVVSFTKSACAFSMGMQVANDEPYESCYEWSEQARQQIIDLEPDLLLVSNRVNQALDDPTDLESRSGEAMVDGLVEQWQVLTDAGVPMAVLLDNPNPGEPIYECVAENMDDLAACTFDLDDGVQNSGAPVQLEAAAQVPGVTPIDLRSAICPMDPCVPVIGNVLVYRQTSHITDTYARTLTEPLAEELVPIVEGGETADGNASAASGIEGLADVEWFTPEGSEAIRDLPQASRDGCSQDQVNPEPIRCEFGDPDGDITIAMVGDSKLIQWQSAIEEIALEEGWHLVSFIKSACAFGTGMQLAKGEPYESCADWNNAMLPEILDLDPDLVLVGNRVNRALEDVNDTGSRTQAAMEDALAQRWEELRAQRIPVVVFLDNPSPGISVYECVQEHADELAECTFDRAAGVESSSALVQQAAADRVPGVVTVDMTEVICPDETCLPVLGNILIYRQTSHLTDTYVRHVTDDVAQVLVPAVDEVARG